MYRLPRSSSMEFRVPSERRSLARGVEPCHAPRVPLIRRLVAAAALASVPLVATAQDPSPRDGQGLYDRGLCPVCHGPDRKGTKSAPPLLELSGSWTAESPAAYLKSPAAMLETVPRLRDLKKKYPSLTMPAYEKSDADRIALASWLLATSLPSRSTESPSPAPATSR